MQEWDSVNLRTFRVRTHHSVLAMLAVCAGRHYVPPEVLLCEVPDIMCHEVQGMCRVRACMCPATCMQGSLKDGGSWDGTGWESYRVFQLTGSWSVLMSVVRKNRH